MYLICIGALVGLAVPTLLVIWSLMIMSKQVDQWELPSVREHD